MDDALIKTAQALLILVQLRNVLAFIWRCRALNEAAQLAFDAADAGDEDCERFFDQVPGYLGPMFDLSQWRYRSPFKAE